MPAMELDARTGWIVSPPVKETWRLSNWIKKSSIILTPHAFYHWLRKRDCRLPFANLFNANFKGN
jgi:hypothetical protein